MSLGVPSAFRRKTAMDVIPLSEREYANMDRGDTPALAVLEANAKAMTYRRAVETQEELGTIKSRVNETLDQYELKETLKPGLPQELINEVRENFIEKDNATLEFVDDLTQLMIILSDPLAKKKYQQHLTIFIVGYENLCMNRYKVLGQLNEFFKNNSKTEDDYTMELINFDIEEVGKTVSEALDKADKAQEKLAVVSKEVIKVLESVNPKEVKSRKRKIDKALQQSKEDIIVLTEKLSSAQRDLEGNEGKLTQLYKTIEVKQIEIERLKTQVEVSKRKGFEAEELKKEVENKNVQLQAARQEIDQLQLTLAKAENRHENLETRQRSVKETQLKNKEDYENKLETMKQKVVDTRKDLESYHDQQLKDMRDMYKEEIETLKQTHQEQMKDLNATIAVLQRERGEAEKAKIAALTREASRQTTAELSEFELRRQTSKQSTKRQLSRTTSKSKRSGMESKTPSPTKALLKDGTMASLPGSSRSQASTREKTGITDGTRSSTKLDAGGSSPGSSRKDPSDLDQDITGSVMDASVQTDDTRMELSHQLSLSFIPEDEIVQFEPDEDVDWGEVPIEELPARFSHYRTDKETRLNELKSRVTELQEKCNEKSKALKAVADIRSRWSQEREKLVSQLQEAEKAKRDADKEAEIALLQTEELLAEQEELKLQLEEQAAKLQQAAKHEELAAKSEELAAKTEELAAKPLESQQGSTSSSTPELKNLVTVEDAATSPDLRESKTPVVVVQDEELQKKPSEGITTKHEEQKPEAESQIAADEKPPLKDTEEETPLKMKITVRHSHSSQPAFHTDGGDGQRSATVDIPETPLPSSAMSRRSNRLGASTPCRDDLMSGRTKKRLIRQALKQYPIAEEAFATYKIVMHLKTDMEELLDDEGLEEDLHRFKDVQKLEIDKDDPMDVLENLTNMREQTVKVILGVQNILPRLLTEDDEILYNIEEDEYEEFSEESESEVATEPSLSDIQEETEERVREETEVTIHTEEHIAGERKTVDGRTDTFTEETDGRVYLDSRFTTSDFLGSSVSPKPSISVSPKPGLSVSPKGRSKRGRGHLRLVSDYKELIRKHHELTEAYQEIKSEVDVKGVNYKEQLKQNSIMIQEMQETIKNLKSEVQEYQLTRPQTYQFSQNPNSTEFIFTQQDIDYNSRALKRGIESGSVEPDVYDHLKGEMEKYTEFPARLLAELARRYSHHVQMKQVEEKIRSSENLDTEVIAVLDKMEELQKRRSQRWRGKMDHLTSERSRLAKMLVKTIEKIQDESGIFLIKPIMSIPPKANTGHGSIVSKRVKSPKQKNGSVLLRAPERFLQKKPRRGVKATITASRVLEDETLEMGSHRLKKPGQEGPLWKVPELSKVPSIFLGGPIAPTILDLDVNRPMFTQNDVSANILPHSLSDGLSAQTSILSYVTVARRPITINMRQDFSRIASPGIIESPPPSPQTWPRSTTMQKTYSTAEPLPPISDAESELKRLPDDLRSVSTCISDPERVVTFSLPAKC